MIHAKQIRLDFPVFQTYPSLVYLDSAATSLKPQSVIQKVSEYYTEYPANIHRGIYHISERATEEYEETRKIMALYVGASSPDEIVFTKNATEAFNLLSFCLAKYLSFTKDDEVATTILEHHANFIPWQRLAQEHKLHFRVLGNEMNKHTPLITEEEIARHVSPHTKILALTHTSNVTGRVHDIKRLIAAAKRINPTLIVIVDAAQSAPHQKISVQELGCDFLVCSGHKMLGPTGVGVLWGRHEILSQLPPYQVGGGMIQSVQLDTTTYDRPPARFEAGTPDIAAVVALKSAVSYLEYIGLNEIHRYECALARYAKHELIKSFGGTIEIVGGGSHDPSESGIISFVLQGVHPHDIAQILDEDSIAVRAGHHCTQPLHTSLGIQATTRVSLYLYNDEQDIARLIQGLKRAYTLLHTS